MPESAPPVGLDLFEWIEASLVVPSGLLAGQAFRVEPWQRRFLRGALADGVTESLLCVARKSGKTSILAALVLAYLVGPLNRAPNWRALAVSLTAKLSGELRSAIRETAEASNLDGVEVVQAEARGLRGARCEFLSADKSSGVGSGAELVVFDELGLLPENRRSLLNACYSSTSARGGRLVAISIRGASSMLEALIDRRGDPSVFVQLHEAPPGCAIDDRAAWAAANPALGTIKSMSYMEAASRRALASPSDQADFRAYDLNQAGSPARETVVTVSDWVSCVTPTPPERAGPCFVGLDLGGASALCGAAASWPETGRLEVWAAVGDTPSLLDRGKTDGVGNRYETMARRGELRTYEGRVTPVAEFLSDLIDRLAGCDIRAFHADRYRQAEALDGLAAAGAVSPLVVRGGGFKDGSEDIRGFQRAVIAGKIRSAPSLLLESAIAESAIQRDAAGNMKLQKGRQAGRIDALSAAVLAVAAGERETARAQAAEARGPAWSLI